ncbi:MAG: D-xylose transport system permease protein [Pseudonocardiales bacterium]|jgi:D-xylose transport system permease protein|nr:D-xylose transport system permease protein [Pseudonocardiales bacterium]
MTSSSPSPTTDVDKPGDHRRAAEPDLAVIAATAPIEGGVGDYFRTYRQRVRSGDMGSLPAVAGLIVLVIVFWSLRPQFGSLANFSDLLKQSSPTIFIAMGLVFVLLLGEIDLAAGTAGGVCATLMARVSVGYGWPWPFAIGAALVAGVAIGFFTGSLCAKVRIPSFVVTLALFLAFQGVILFIVLNGAGAHGNISITDNFITNLYNGQMDPWLGWALAVVAIVSYALIKLQQVRSRSKAGLTAEPIALVAIKVAALAVIAGLAVYLLNLNRGGTGGSQLINQGGKLVLVKPPALQGVPWVVLIMMFFFALWTFVLSRTRYGRHVYATGGNTEAARRAGIRVDLIRISVFMISSFMAAVGGVLLASNTHSVDANTGGGNTLLLAVGAAVIGGTSLFGGRGRPADAIIGGFVVAVIANGMADLVQGNNRDSIQFIVTGAVLLLAAAVDALSRRRSGATGVG